jgi:hypothetical protein
MLDKDESPAFRPGFLVFWIDQVDQYFATTGAGAPQLK